MNDRCLGCGGKRGTGADARDGFHLCPSCAKAVDEINSRAAAEQEAIEYLVRRQEFRNQYPSIGSRAMSG